MLKLTKIFHIQLYLIIGDNLKVTSPKNKEFNCFKIVKDYKNNSD